MFIEIYRLFRMEMNSGSILGYFLQAVPITIIIGSIYSINRLVFLKHRSLHIVWFSEFMKLAFVCYMTGLCSLVILPTNFWLSFFDAFFFGWWKDVGSIFNFGEINLIPTIVMCLSGDYTLGSWVKDMIVGNIIMFIPLGFFLPFVFKNLNRRKSFMISLIVPFVIEFLQLFVGRSFDIDDLICNFLGIIIGFIIANMIKKVVGVTSRQK